MDFKKRLAEWLMMLLACSCRDSGLWKLDPRIAEFDRSLDIMKELEDCPRMKLRWSALQRIFRWLFDAKPGYDGAYRLRLLILLNIVVQNPKIWRLEPWEADLLNRIAKRKKLRLRFGGESVIHKTNKRQRWISHHRCL